MEVQVMKKLKEYKRPLIRSESIKKKVGVFASGGGGRPAFLPNGKTNPVHITPC